MLYRSSLDESKTRGIEIQNVAKLHPKKKTSSFALAIHMSVERDIVREIFKRTQGDKLCDIQLILTIAKLPYVCNCRRVTL